MKLSTKYGIICVILGSCWIFLHEHTIVAIYSVAAMYFFEKD